MMAAPGLDRAGSNHPIMEEAVNSPLSPPFLTFSVLVKGVSVSLLILAGAVCARHVLGLQMDSESGFLLCSYGSCPLCSLR